MARYMARRSSSFRSRASRASRSTTVPLGSRIRTSSSSGSATSPPECLAGWIIADARRASPSGRRAAKGGGPARLAVEDLGDPVVPAPLHHADPDVFEASGQDDASMGGAPHHHPVDPPESWPNPHVLPEEPPASGGEAAGQAGVMEQPALAGHPAAVPASHAREARGEAEGTHAADGPGRIHQVQDPELARGGRRCGLKNG